MEISMDIVPLEASQTCAFLIFSNINNINVVLRNFEVVMALKIVS
jgi:hypothetical protein